MTDTARKVRLLRRFAAQLERGEALHTPADDLPTRAAVNLVDVNELTQVIEHWGEVVDTPLTSHPAIVVPPPSGTQQPSGPIQLGNGPASYSNLAISGGILCDNATHVTMLTLTNCTATSGDYPLYSGNTDSAIIDRCEFHATGGNNDYATRGIFHNWHSMDSKWINSGANKAVFRLYDVQSFLSERDRFSGSRMMLGGGAAAETADPQQFTGTFRNAAIACSSVEIYPRSAVRFEQCDFTGSGHCTVWSGGGSCVCVGCTKDGHPLTLAFFQNGAAGVVLQ